MYNPMAYVRPCMHGNRYTCRQTHLHAAKDLFTILLAMGSRHMILTFGSSTAIALRVRFVRWRRSGFCSTLTSCCWAGCLISCSAQAMMLGGHVSRQQRLWDKG